MKGCYLKPITRRSVESTVKSLFCCQWVATYRSLGVREEQVSIECNQFLWSSSEVRSSVRSQIQHLVYVISHSDYLIRDVSFDEVYDQVETIADDNRPFIHSFFCDDLKRTLEGCYLFCYFMSWVVKWVTSKLYLFRRRQSFVSPDCWPSSRLRAESPLIWTSLTFVQLLISRATVPFRMGSRSSTSNSINLETAIGLARMLSCTFIMIT